WASVRADRRWRERRPPIKPRSHTVIRLKCFSQTCSQMRTCEPGVHFGAFARATPARITSAQVKFSSLRRRVAISAAVARSPGNSEASRPQMAIRRSTDLSDMAHVFLLDRVRSRTYILPVRTIEVQRKLMLHDPAGHRVLL